METKNNQNIDILAQQIDRYASGTVQIGGSYLSDLTYKEKGEKGEKEKKEKEKEKKGGIKRRDQKA